MDPNTMPRILCGTDFSDASRAASDAAVELGAKLGAAVLVAHAYEPPIPPGELGFVIPAVSVEFRAEAERRLSELVATLRIRGIAAVDGRVVDGPAARALLALAEELQPELVVVGRHGAGLGRTLLGSVPAFLARHVGRPFLAVGADAPLGSRLRSGEPLRVLVGLGFDAPSQLALGWVRRFRSHVPCDLFFFHVRELVPTPPGALEEALWRRIGELPGEGRVELEAAGGEASVADQLEARARAIGADLVVVGTHARGALARLWYGSHAERVLKRSHAPVVCVPGLPPGALAERGPVEERLEAAPAPG